MRVDLQEFRAAYLAEVDEHLSAANQRLLDIDAARREGRRVGRELRELMRLLHTIKGLSSMVGVEPVVDLAHEMETVVRAADQSAAQLDEAAIEALVEGLRAVQSRVSALARNEEVAAGPPALIARLSSIVSRPATIAPPSLQGNDELNARLTASEKQQLAAAAATGRRAVKIEFAPSPRKADAGISITSVRERIARIGELVRVIPLSAPASEQAPGGLVFALFVVTTSPDAELANLVGGTTADVTPLLAASPVAILPSTLDDGSDDDDVRRTGFLRVDVARVDATIEKLSALIVTRSRLERAVTKLSAQGADTRELAAIALDAKRQLRDLRGALLSVRMVPLASVLDRLPLVTRGLGRTTGKMVRLVVEAGTTELDKTVAERLFPVFVHCIRNAVDHGIEPPVVRRAAGKSDEGTIVISAQAVGSRIVEVRIMDDGAGIDASAVAARAGLAEAPRTPAALLELLCRPGFSTRAVADQTSGRGMGMDIAKRTIEGLGGELELETERGRGTTLTLRVPLTIAVVEAFTVSSSGRRFAIPVPAVSEIIEVNPESLPVSPRTTGREVRLLGRRGETIALVELSAALGFCGDASASRSGARHAVVVRSTADDTVAFAIDKVLGQQEAVIRPLTDPLVTVAGVSGSTDLGDGEPTLVLDLMALSASLGGAS